MRLATSFRARTLFGLVATALPIAVALPMGFGGEPAVTARSANADRVTPVERFELSRSDRFAVPFAMAVVGPNLLIGDLASDSTLHVVSRETGDIMRSFGRRGEGPGEFSSAWSLDPVPGTRTAAWIYDLDLARLTYVDLHEDFFTAGLLGTRMINLAMDATPLAPVRTRGGAFLSLGLFAEGRLAEIDAEGRQGEIYGVLPGNARRAPPAVRQHAYQSTLVSNHQRARFAAFPRHASQIEIYREDGTPAGTIEGPVTIEPDLSASTSRGFVMPSDRPFGYLGAAAASDLLFGLFSGRSQDEFGGRAFASNVVHVFAWTGGYLGALELERDAVSITVDEGGCHLYAIEHDPAPTVVVYGVPPAMMVDRVTRSTTSNDQGASATSARSPW